MQADRHLRRKLENFCEKGTVFCGLTLMVRRSSIESIRVEHSERQNRFQGRVASHRVVPGLALLPSVVQKRNPN